MHVYLNDECILECCGYVYQHSLCKNCTVKVHNCVLVDRPAIPRLIMLTFFWHVDVHYARAWNVADSMLHTQYIHNCISQHIRIKFILQCDMHDKLHIYPHL